MKIKFSTSWKKSKQPRKQRLYRYNAPLHIKRRFVRAHLSKELRAKYNRRSLGLRKGDKVKVVRGQFKKTEGKIEKINTKRERLYIDGISVVKKDGTKVSYPINPSNVIITELSLDDRMRQRILERKNTKKKLKTER
nr:50S ribosomal protein L24P [uncultured archaeon]